LGPLLSRRQRHEAGGDEKVVGLVDLAAARHPANNPAHPSWLPVAVSLGIVGVGAIAFLVWARIERTWPFGPNEIREEYAQAAMSETVSKPA
jgi:hypothetical protein